MPKRGFLRVVSLLAVWSSVVQCQKKALAQKTGSVLQTSSQEFSVADSWCHSCRCAGRCKSIPDGISDGFPKTRMFLEQNCITHENPNFCVVVCRWCASCSRQAAWNTENCLQHKRLWLPLLSIDCAGRMDTGHVPLSFLRYEVIMIYLSFICCTILYVICIV